MRIRGFYCKTPLQSLMPHLQQCLQDAMIMNQMYLPTYKMKVSCFNVYKILLSVRVTITQKNGSGLHTAAAYFWDTLTDGTCTVRWENKYMYCIVNVWGMSLQL